MPVPGASTPKVSVVMPVFRPHPRYFAEAIDSVLAQTFTDWELVVVEDPSERLGRETLETRRDPRIRYFLNPARTGLPRQHNRAVAESCAELIARFDADDICEPERLERQLAFLERHPEVDVVASRLRIIDEHGTIIGRRDYPQEHEAIVRAMRRYNPLSGSNVMFRRRLAAEAGGWRETVDLPAQDYEWYSRLASRGYRFAIPDEYLVRYRLHRGQLKQRNLRGTLRSTLEVKRRYWLSSMDPLSLALFSAEALLLAFPPAVVLWLFRKLRYGSA
jgi:glycosyltransferase involved in cell wall biosynthesis